MTGRQRVGILLFPDFDLLDSGGPYEVFLTANRLAERGGTDAPFEVITVGLDEGPVAAYGGLQLLPSTGLDSVGPLDVVVIPGAVDVDEVLGNEQIAQAVTRLVESAALASSVCTGAFLLAAAGLLAGRSFTTHWEDLADLDAVVEDGTAVAEVRWVDAGQVVTGGGLSSGLHMALHLVDRLAGRDLAIATGRQICQSWNPDDPAF